jgi:hypothetical protein
MSAVVVELPGVRLHNPLNGNKGGHWAPRAKRAAMQRGAARLVVQPQTFAIRAILALADAPQVVVTITRIAPGTLDDDATPASAKAVRDGVADALGVKDNDARISWRYAQEKSKRGIWGVRVHIEAVALRPGV